MMNHSRLSPEADSCSVKAEKTHVLREAKSPNAWGNPGKFAERVTNSFEFRD